MAFDEKKIINGVMERKNDYFRSTAFSLFKEQGSAVNAAVDQRYREGEQTTKSGFYLATTTSMYEAIIETFSQSYFEASPLFVFDSKRMNGEDLALKAQRFHNRVWANMGADNSGGTAQWMQLCRDVPIFNMAVGHPRWKRMGGMVEKPIVSQGAWSNSIEWSTEFDLLLNEPDIQRIHPFNWFGQYDKGQDLSYEGFLDEWDMSIVAALMKDDSYKKDNLEKLAEEMKKGQNEWDNDFFKESTDRFALNSKKTPVTVYWGSLNHIKGLEDDPGEYLVICDSKRIYKMAVNRIPGFRQLIRVRSNVLNDLPFGRSLLAPSLPHTKIMNLYANLGIDDTVMRMHNGWAIWDEFLVNPDEFLNPEGTNNTVSMRKDAPPGKIPQRIGRERSGVLDDMLQMYQLINRDNEAAGLTEQAKGLKAAKRETATGQMLDAKADDRRVRSAIITMAQTGLKPIAKQVLMMALRNTPEIERRNLSYDGEVFDVTNQDMAQIWNNAFFDINDTINKNQDTEATKLVNFLGTSREILMQDPRGLEYLQNMLRDIGRRSGLSNVERYFPENTPTPIQSQTPQPQGEPIPSGVSPAAPPAGGVPTEAGAA